MYPTEEWSNLKQDFGKVVDSGSGVWFILHYLFIVKQGPIPAKNLDESNYYSKLRFCLQWASKMVSYILYKELTEVALPTDTYISSISEILLWRVGREEEVG